MTDDRSLERAARSWIEDGPTRAPDRVVEAALSRSKRRHKNGIFGSRGGSQMTIARVAAAAVIGVLASAAPCYLIACRPGGNVGGRPTDTALCRPDGSGSVATAESTGGPDVACARERCAMYEGETCHTGGRGDGGCVRREGEIVGEGGGTQGGGRGGFVGGFDVRGSGRSTRGGFERGG